MTLVPPRAAGIVSERTPAEATYVRGERPGRKEYGRAGPSTYGSPSHGRVIGRCAILQDPSGLEVAEVGPRSRSHTAAGVTLWTRRVALTGRS